MTTTSRLSPIGASLAIILMMIAAAPVAADWLVTNDGDRIETDGPWKVEGRRIVFTLADGRLSMMRASEIDLEASEAATAEALRPPPPDETDAAQAEPELTPVLVLTNDDIGPGTATASAPDGDAVSTTSSESSELRVVRWRREDGGDDGLELRGTVRNLSRNLAADVRITATIRDAEGDIVGTGNAFLDATSMVAGSSTRFRVLFDGVYDFIGEPEWSIEAEMLEVGAEGSPTASGSAADGGAGDTDESSVPAQEPEVEPAAEGEGEGGR